MITRLRIFSLLVAASAGFCAEAKNPRKPASIDCSRTAKEAAIKKASETKENCQAIDLIARSVEAGNLSLYFVTVSCPAFDGDISMYAYNVKTKVAFAAGNGHAACFASEVSPVSAPPAALQ